jgi:hypothetical protein
MGGLCKPLRMEEKAQCPRLKTQFSSSEKEQDEGKLEPWTLRLLKGEEDKQR